MVQNDVLKLNTEGNVNEKYNRYFDTVGVVLGATAKTVSFDDVSESVRSNCPTCLAAGQPIMEVLNEQCGKPYTLDTWDEVSQKSGVYAFMMALNGMMPQEMMSLTEEAMKESVTCDDEDLWIEKIKEAMESEKYQEKMISIVEQQQT